MRRRRVSEWWGIPIIIVGDVVLFLIAGWWRKRHS